MVFVFVIASIHSIWIVAVVVEVAVAVVVIILSNSSSLLLPCTLAPSPWLACPGGGDGQCGMGCFPGGWSVGCAGDWALCCLSLLPLALCPVRLSVVVLPLLLATSRWWLEQRKRVVVVGGLQASLAPRRDSCYNRLRQYLTCTSLTTPASAVTSLAYARVTN